MFTGRLLGSAGGPTDFPDPSGWTLLDFWDSRDGDLATGFREYFIDLGQSFRPTALAWSPDGTKITFTETGTQDKIFTFGVSTPFDPETINYSPTSVRTRLNPQRLQYSVNGGRAFSIASPDVVCEYPASNWGITAIGNDIGNSFSVFSDGPFALSSTSDELIWAYQSAFGQPYRLRKVSFATGIDNATVTQTSDPTPFSINIGNAFTVMSLSGTKWYHHASSSGTRLWTLDNPMDVSSFTVGDAVNVYTQLPQGHPVIYGDSIWIDPNNSRYVWYLDTLGLSADRPIQFMLYDTNTTI